MNERFSYTGASSSRLPRIPLWLLFLVLWTAIITIFVVGVGRFGDYTENKQRESLERALQRNIAQCYAIEGMYPPDIDWLVNHYGLTYDESRFFIDYYPVGSNLYPDVTVIDRKGKKTR